MNSDNIWLDPLYLDDLLSEEEKSIRKSTQDYCDKYLLPKVIKDNRKHHFDKNIEPNIFNRGNNSQSILFSTQNLVPNQRFCASRAHPG